jgi:hypothetical protein
LGNGGDRNRDCSLTSRKASMTSWLEELLESVSSARHAVQGAPTEHRLAAMIPAERVQTDGDPSPQRIGGDRFIPGMCYFGVRLAGLHLTKARRYSRQQLPLCVCLAEFGSPGSTQTVPFSIGPDIIRKRLVKAGVRETEGVDHAWIEMRDITILHPTPVRNSNLSLFVGLYAVPGDDLVKTLLNVLGDLGCSLGLLPGGPAVKMAKAVYCGFSSLLGLDSVQPQAEALNGRALPDTGSGYLLVGNAPADAIEKRNLTVRRGTLYEGDGTQVVTDFDYCLVAIEHYPTLVEGTGLAPDLFDEHWRDVVSALNEGFSEAATKARAKLVGAILTAPHITEADRDLLMSSYLALYQKRTQQLAGFRGGSRGKATDLATAVSRLGGANAPDKSVRRALGGIYEQMEAPGSEPVDGGQLTAREAMLRQATILRPLLIQADAQPGNVAMALARASALADL